jgi:polyisoprenoid-binding protein YceI
MILRSRKPALAPCRRRAVALVAPLLAAALPLPAVYAASADYQLVTSHADLVFEVNHLGFSNKHGLFREFAGTLKFDADHPEHSQVDITVQADSIDTGHTVRDTELKGAKFFDSAKFPQIHFVSTRLTPDGEQRWKVEGQLTMHGITHPLELKATLNKVGANAFDKKPTVGFSASGVLKRSDYGISTLVPAIADEVRISVDAEFNHE